MELNHEVCKIQTVEVLSFDRIPLLDPWIKETPGNTLNLIIGFDVFMEEVLSATEFPFLQLFGGNLARGESRRFHRHTLLIVVMVAHVECETRKPCSKEESEEEDNAERSLGRSSKSLLWLGRMSAMGLAIITVVGAGTMVNSSTPTGAGVTLTGMAGAACTSQEWLWVTAVVGT